MSFTGLFRNIKHFITKYKTFYLVTINFGLSKNYLKITIPQKYT